LQNSAPLENVKHGINFIIKGVSIQLGINRKNKPTNTSKFQLLGKFMASFGEMNGQSMMPMCIHWHNEKKNGMGFSVSVRFKFCIQSLAEHLEFKENSRSQATLLSKFMRKIVCNL
jgi:hypothetical protein